MFIAICGYNIVAILTISVYSPAHKVLTDIIKSFLSWVFIEVIFYEYFEIEKTNTKFSVGFISLGYAIAFIGLLIFLEIIIFNCMGR